MKSLQRLIPGILSLVFLTPLSQDLSGQYQQPDHRQLREGEIAVTEPGSYAKSGATYVLMNDIAAPGTAVFLGKDITLDLNGYTIRFADGNYEHVSNGGFEEGLKGWDTSMAPSARTEGKKVHVFIGDSILRMSEGEEIVSSWISLPYARRSWDAMCGVIGPQMKISLFVEDETGKSVRCITEYSDSTAVSCPVLKASPRLGGGFVFAHLNGLPAGRYRIRVKAETDCLVDQIDIRPAMDVGIGIVGKTHPAGSFAHLYNRTHCAFFDYTSDVKTGTPVAGVPQVTGKGTVTIRNGVIRNGTRTILSWGIQSTADDVSLVLENLHIVSTGINSTAVDVPQAVITECTFDVDNPFIINRHGSEFYAVDLRGEMPSEVSFSDFQGGQGCLVFKGNNSKVHHNTFVNRQTVTNHYSIMAIGDSSLVFDNLITPETGSGIEVYVHRGMEIFNNEIHIEASPPTCEYGHEDYSVNAIRIADYNAKPGSVDGCFGNKVYNNRIFVDGRDYPEYTDYIPMAYGIFYSSSAGENYIFGNEFTVTDHDKGMKNETAALYIGGGSIGGEFFDNRITANVPAIWVASRYGGAKDTKISHNTIISPGGNPVADVPVRMGWTGWKGCIARDVQFHSNTFSGTTFAIDRTDQGHSYQVFWTLMVKLTDRKGQPLAGREIIIIDKSGKEAARLQTDVDGKVEKELLQCAFDRTVLTDYSPYTVIAGKNREIVKLEKNTEIVLQAK